jgi:hypothetical protein
MLTYSSGTIANGRVQGVLAVTRSLGDVEYKTLRNESWGGDGKLLKADVVSGEPYIYTLDLHDFDEFLVLASDGLFNGMSNENVVNYVRKHMCLGVNLTTVATDLVNEAATRSPQGDNVTVIILLFEEENVVSTHHASIQRSGRIESDTCFSKTEPDGHMGTTEGENNRVMTMRSSRRASVSTSLGTTASSRNVQLHKINTKSAQRKARRGSVMSPTDEDSTANAAETAFVISTDDDDDGVETKSAAEQPMSTSTMVSPAGD